MDTLEQPIKAKALRFFVCLFFLPISAYAGLLLNAALSPEIHVSSAFASWMAIFVLSVFVPTHLAVLALAYLLLRNRVAAWQPLTAIPVCCILVVTAIGFSRSTNPFSLVFSWPTIPLFIVAYTIAVGREKPGNPFKSKPLRGSA